METFNLKEVETISHQYCSEVPMNGCDKEKIKQYYLKTYQLHEALFELISDPEAFYLRAESLRHPLIFYYGHTAAFYMNKLTDRGIITERINPRLEAVLAVGVDEMKWDDLNEAHYDWPSVDEVKEFRRQVNDKVLEAIDKVDEEISWTSDMWVIMMTIEHERVHL